MKKLLLLISLAAICSCASRAPVAPPAPPPIRSIAVIAGDPLSGALGGALFDQGYKTFELPATQDLSLGALRGLATRGVDGVLVVKSVRGLDTHPDSASVRVLRAANGATVATFDWTNPAGAARMNTATSARELVKTLHQNLSR